MSRRLSASTARRSSLGRTDPMMENVEQDIAALDNVAHFIEAYRAIDAQIKQLGETRESIRREIQAALGDNQVGTVNGRKVVRWTRFLQHRLSTTAVRNKFSDDDLADCYKDVTQSRFSLIDED